MNDYISVYTRQNAIDDGIFTDVSEVAKFHGFTIPVALTSNLYNSHIKNYEDQEQTTRNLNAFLAELYKKILNAFVAEINNEISHLDTNDNMIICTFTFTEPTKVWAIVEPQSPTDSSLAMNVMLPEDY